MLTKTEGFNTTYKQGKRIMDIYDHIHKSPDGSELSTQ